MFFFGVPGARPMSANLHDGMAPAVH